MRIRELREDNDFNQEEVAKILNVQQATYSRYETGALEISLDDLCKLADFYHTSTDYRNLLRIFLLLSALNRCYINGFTDS